MPRRVEYSTGTTWEETFGYSRAVRVGDTVRVAGTTPVEDGEVVAPGDPYEQTEHVLGITGDALAELGARPEDVVSTRIYVTDFDDWEGIGRAHREFFGDVRPATSLLEIASLPEPGMCLELETEAVASRPTE